MERSAEPATVVVDLTPVRPGGENGGAKVFALRLIPLLSRLTPNWEFVLLTTRLSDTELAALDASNVRRYCVDATAADR